MTILDEVRECRSPQIVGLYGYYKAVKYFWVVMEFCHGYSVFNLMTQLNRPLKESQIRTVLSHVLKGFLFKLDVFIFGIFLGIFVFTYTTPTIAYI